MVHFAENKNDRTVVRGRSIRDGLHFVSAATNRCHTLFSPVAVVKETSTAKVSSRTRESFYLAGKTEFHTRTAVRRASPAIQ